LYVAPLDFSQAVRSPLFEKTRSAQTMLVGRAEAGGSALMSSVAPVTRPNAKPAAAKGAKIILTVLRS
jgi:hypothetical protein